jgi:hypothetical protein
MTSYPPPTRLLPIYNSIEFITSTIPPELLNIFVPKSGGIFSGNVDFSTGMRTLSTTLLGNGTNTSPAIRFSDELNTGLFKSATNTISFSSNGTKVVDIAPLFTSMSGRLDVPNQPFIKLISTQVSGTLVTNLFYSLLGAGGSAPSNIFGTPTESAGFTFDASTGLITVLSNGIYHINCSLTLDDTDEDGKYIILILNDGGTVQYGKHAMTSSLLNTSEYLEINQLVRLNANDKVQAVISHGLDNAVTISYDVGGFINNLAYLSVLKIA